MIRETADDDVASRLPIFYRGRTPTTAGRKPRHHTLHKRFLSNRSKTIRNQRRVSSSSRSCKSTTRLVNEVEFLLPSCPFASTERGREKKKRHTSMLTRPLFPLTKKKKKRNSVERKAITSNGSPRIVGKLALHK